MFALLLFVGICLCLFVFGFWGTPPARFGVSTRSCHCGVGMFRVGILTIFFCIARSASASRCCTLLLCNRGDYCRVRLNLSCTTALCMSQPSRTYCGRRFVVVSAVTFLAPCAQHQRQQLQHGLSCFISATHVSTLPSSSRSSTSTFFGSIQIAPPQSPAAAAAAERGTRYRRGSSSSTLFAAVVPSSEEVENDREGGAGDFVVADGSQQEEVVFGREKTATAVPGRSSTRRTSELGRPRLRQHSRSVVHASRKTLGRLFRRNFTEEQEEEEEVDDDDAKFNSVVAQRAEQVRCDCILYHAAGRGRYCEEWSAWYIVYLRCMLLATYFLSIYENI